MACKYPAWFRKPENLLALSIALILLITHLVIIDRVDELIYDEKSFVAEANIILALSGGEDQDPFLANYDGEVDPIHTFYLKGLGYDDIKEYKDRGYAQHAPLARLFLAAGIGVFGDNAWGWRIFPVLFGTLAVIIFYLICQRLTAHRWLPLTATFIFAFENMCFVMSGIATLDAIAFTLMMASFLVYLRGNYISSGLTLALGALAKEMAVLGGGVIFFHWLLAGRKSKLDGVKFLVAAPLAYVLLLPLFDYIALREFIYPWDRIYNIMVIGSGSQWDMWSDQYASLVNAIHTWEWVIKPEALMIWRDPSYEITASWTLWVLIIPVMFFALYEAVRHRWHSFCLFALLWFVWLYLFWFIIEAVTQRFMYAYYFYPVIGAVCLALGYLVWRLLSIAVAAKDRKVGWVIGAPAVLWMMAHFVLFWVMAPIT